MPQPKRKQKRADGEVVVPRTHEEGRGNHPARRDYNACFTLLVKATSEIEHGHLNVTRPVDECTSIFITHHLVCVIHEAEGLSPAIVGMQHDHVLNSGIGHDMLLMWYNAAGETYTEYLS